MLEDQMIERLREVKSLAPDMKGKVQESLNYLIGKCVAAAEWENLSAAADAFHLLKSEGLTVENEDDVVRLLRGENEFKEDFLK
jgi:hypothetical protein